MDRGSYDACTHTYIPPFCPDSEMTGNALQLGAFRPAGAKTANERER